MNAARSDARLLWRHGDLAYKQTFPALYALAQEHTLNIPLIGVANAGWNLDSLKARARDSVHARGEVDETVLAGFASVLRHVGGDYRGRRNVHGTAPRAR
jgi:glucose-6-phosphate 1-dehydrogenase